MPEPEDLRLLPDAPTTRTPDAASRAGFARVTERFEKPERSSSSAASFSSFFARGAFAS